MIQPHEKGHRCPVCGVLNDAVMPVTEDWPDVQIVKPGDMSICAHCFAIGIFRDDGSVRVATTEECYRIPDWLRSQLAMMAQTTYGKPS